MEFAELIKTPRADNVVLHRPFYQAVEGTLCLTGHHLIFSSRRHDNAEELWLLHSNIDSIEKRYDCAFPCLIVCVLGLKSGCQDWLAPWLSEIEV